MNIYELHNYSVRDYLSFHKDLNPRIWDKNKIRPEVRQALLKIADDFVSFMGISDISIVDITLSGSNAAYSYTMYSDIDLHVLVNFEHNNDDEEVYTELFNAKKFQYNEQHDITVAGYPVEVYAHFSDSSVSSGEYSLLKNKWIHIPINRRPNINEKAAVSKYQQLKYMLDAVLKTDNIDIVTDAISLVARYRKAGLTKHGEFGPENLAYKMVRSQALVKKLYDHKFQLTSKILSIKEGKVKKSKRSRNRVTKPKNTYRAFGGLFYPGYGYFNNDSAQGDFGDGGCGESINENLELVVSGKPTSIIEIVQKFVTFTAKYIDIEGVEPEIVLKNKEFSSQNQSMGSYNPDTHIIEIAVYNRHIMDILRTVAHELVHLSQFSKQPFNETAGLTGSNYENEANAIAGVIMRDFRQQCPELFDTKAVTEGIKSAMTAGILAAASIGHNAGATTGAEAHAIGKQIYQPSGIFTKAGASEEAMNIVKSLARGEKEIRIGGKLVYKSNNDAGDRVAANAIGSDADAAYSQALARALHRAGASESDINNLKLGDWKVVDYEADQVGNQFRATVAIEKKN